MAPRALARAREGFRGNQNRSRPGTRDAASRPGGAERAQKVEAFGRAIDALRKEAEAKVGAEDVAYIKRVRKLSRRAEILGGTLIHASIEPLGFFVGVGALTVHKLLETIEIGHTSLHGTYDKLLGAEAFHSKTFHWKAPIDEASWKHAHNVQHHQYTNVSGRDPDMNFAVLRLSHEVPYRTIHMLQPVSNTVSSLWFIPTINTHVTGLVDVYAAYPRQAETLPDHSTKSKLEAHKLAFLKFARYYAREFGFFPLLAGRSLPRSPWATCCPRWLAISTQAPPSIVATWAPRTIRREVTLQAVLSGTSCKWRLRVTSK